ncbi:MAG: cysteine desulfurase, partial [Flammeovirgaceae bacterium]
GNNEIGTIINLKEMGEICKKHDALCHSDTVQTMGYYDMDLASLPICSIVGSAHKFHGPKGVGFLYLKKGRKILPYITGGAQERNMRGGTENVIGIVGMTKALEMSIENREKNKQHILGLKERMKSQLTEQIPGVQFNGTSGDLEESVYKVLSVSLPPNTANDMLLFNLDLKGISASGGSACSSGADRGSHVLQALNGDFSRKSVRFSFSKFNTEEEIDYTVEKLVELCKVDKVATV